MTRQRATRSGGLTFGEWKMLVEHWLDAIAGVDSESIPDWDYWQAYEDDMLPVRAARQALAEAGLE